MKRDKNFQTKVIIRRLPPSLTEEHFIEQFSPLPEHDYLYFVKADMRLGSHAFSRAYINFLIAEDIFLFKDKFDGYVLLDSKGNEFPAVVEFAPFQKIPRKRNVKKRDAKSGTITTDPDYLKFVENLKNPDEVILPPAEVYLEEIETREKELKANNGVPKKTTPLIEYLKARKIEQQKIREEKREERKRKEMEKKRLREEERKRRKAEKEKAAKEKSPKEEKETDEPLEEEEPTNEKQSAEPVVQVLKNPEREKEPKESPTPVKNKDYYVHRGSKTKDNKAKRSEWVKDRQKAPTRTYRSVYIRRQPDASETYSKRKDSEQETSKGQEISKEIDRKPKEEEGASSSKRDGRAEDRKDPRAERRIKNKDRPSLEIYKPGMRRFSTQRSTNSPQKEVSTSASNSSSPSPTPPAKQQGSKKSE